MKTDITLLYKKIEGTLTSEEEAVVDRWLRKSAVNRNYYDAIEKRVLTGESSTVSESRKDSNRRRFGQRLIEADRRRIRRKRMMIAASGAAAVVLLILAVPVLFRTAPQPENTPYGPGPGVGVVAAETPKRSTGAIRLTASSGNALDLSFVKDHVVESGADYLLTENGAERLYKNEGAAEQAGTGMNILDVEKGSEFSITLRDGTRVWLNSDSRLEYPENFGDVRRVVLHGEAYFDVARDSKRPFIVATADMDVRVYGTEFNVNTRKRDRITTTLVTGSVALQIHGSDEEIRLKPNKTAEFNALTNKVVINERDVNLYIGWKNGIYLFDNTPIDDLMTELALWHDLTVRFEDEALRYEKFSGSISRRSSLAALLQTIEKTRYVSFEVDGKDVTVKKPRTSR